MECCIFASLNKYSHLLRLILLEMILRELMKHIKATLLQGCKSLNQDARMPLHLQHCNTYAEGKRRTTGYISDSEQLVTLEPRRI